MQAVQIRFNRPLKNALLADSTVAIAFEAGDQEKNRRLAETDLSDTAKTSFLIKQELATFCSSLERQVKSLNERSRETLSQFQELTIQLSMEIATAVVGYEVTHHETRIRQLLKNLIAEHMPTTPIVAYVNKHNLERLRITCQDTPSLDSMLQLRIDDSLAPGDVRVEFDDRRMIASCQEQLANIQKQLMEYLFDARFESSNS